MKTKRFDCVDMMHRGAKRIYRATRDLSRSQELEYWRQKAAQAPARKTEAVEKHGAASKGRK